MQNSRCLPYRVCITADKLSGSSGVAGTAMSSIAANAIATPAAMTEIEPGLLPSAGVAAAHLASSVIMTCFLNAVSGCRFEKTEPSSRFIQTKKGRFRRKAPAKDQVLVDKEACARCSSPGVENFPDTTG